MNIKTSTSLLLSILTAVIAACDPCIITVSNGGIPQAIAVDCGQDSAGTTTGGGGDDSSGGESSTTGDACGPESDYLPTCAAPPSPGDMWGPCMVGDVCKAGSVCRTTAVGSVCAAACVGPCGCGNPMCVGGTCSEDACIAGCSAANTSCPAPGMACDLDAGMCVYPS